MKRIYVAVVVLLVAVAGCRGKKPLTPDPVRGSEWVRLDSVAGFTAQTTDPEAGELCYRMDWGEGDTTGWSGWFENGVEVALEHAWPARGNYAVRVQARDGKGNCSDWSDALAVHVLPEPGYPTVEQTTIELDFEPGDIVASRDGQLVYVSAAYEEVLGIIRTSDNSLTQVPCAAMVHLALSPDNRFLYGMSDADFGEYLYKVRLSDYVVIDTADVGPSTYGYAVTPNGQFLYASYDHEDSSCLVVYRTSDLERVAAVDLGDLFGPLEVAVSRDGRYAYASLYELGRVAVVRTEDNTLVGSITVHSYPYGLAALPGRDNLYVANSDGMDVSVIRTSDNRAVALVPITGGWPFFEQVYAAPSSEFVYVPRDDGSMSVIRTSDNTVVDDVEYPGGFELAPLLDGSRVYGLDEWNKAVVVLGFE